MTWYSLTHLADRALLAGLADHVANERSEAALVLAYVAEVDERRLYVPAAYPSMHAYCTGALGMTDDVAGKRIQAARAARECPELFEAVRDGRLTLSGVSVLAPHVERENVGECLAACARRPVLAIRRWVEERFGRGAPVGETLALPRTVTCETGQVVANVACENGEQHATWHVGAPVAGASEAEAGAADGGAGACGATVGGVSAAAGPGVAGDLGAAGAAPPTFELRVRLDAAAQADLRHAQDLLAHVVRHGDVSQVIGRALKALVRELEKRRCGATDRPRQAGARRKAKAARDPRHVPAHVRGAVWQRDGGRCTFTSEAGRRCEATALLELDHVTPVAKGGGSTVANLRLRCRAHNQYAAEQAYGAGFMQRRREAAKARAEAKRAATAQARGARATTQRQAAETRAQEKRAREAECREASEARAQAREAARAAAEARTRDEAALRAAAEEVIPWLREMGCRPPQARSLAADAAAALPDAPLDARVKHALQRLGPPSARTIPPPGCSPA